MLVIAGLGSVLVLAGWRLRWGGASLGAEISSSRALLIAPALLVIVVLVLAAEQLWPAERQRLTSRAYRQDFLYFVLTVVAFTPVAALMSLAFAGVLGRLAPWAVLPPIAGLPRPALIGALLVAMDACNWVAHLANHRVRALWRLHELHHSQEQMNVFTTFRTHPLIHLSYLLAAVPGILLLANGVLPAGALSAYLCLVMLSHANLRFGYGPLGRLLVSPRYHRVHHAASGRIDVNLGFVLTVWDVCARRAVFPAAGAPVATGLAGRPVPVEQAGERAGHLGILVRQLLEPFLRQEVPVSARAMAERADQAA